MKNRPRIVVTGGAGFIGSHLVDKLVNQDCWVTVIDNLSLGKQENINPKADFWQEDIRNLGVIKSIFKGVDYVFHCAAMPRIQPSIKNPDESFTNNLQGTHNVLEAARLAGVKRVVYSGSSSVYGDQPELPLHESATPRPKNPYALHKLMGEQLCRQFIDLYNLSIVCLRYFNVYGERQSIEGAYATVVGIFLRQKESGLPLTIVGDGSIRRDFTYVDDVTEANCAAMESVGAVGDIINIGTGTNYSIKESAALIENGTPYHCFLPSWPGESKETLADIAKARKLLGYKPTTLLPDWIKFQLQKMGESVV